MGTTNPVRIRLRYADLDAFVEKFAPNVTRGGVFVASRNVQAVGSLIDFEIQLVTGEVALAGQGKVTWVKEFNPAEPNRPYGMGVQFVNVAAESRAVLARLLRSKAAGQPPPRGLTGMHATLGGGVVGGAGSAGSGAPVAVGGGVSGPNGKPATWIDTSVDLAAELGIDEAALRLALNRRRMIGARSDDDLSDLLRREPPEPATLAQALGDLPRLLDPQSSRRRSTPGFRPAELPGQPGEAALLATPSPAAAPPAGAPAEAEGPTVDPAPATSAGEDLSSTSGEDSNGAIPVVLSNEPSSRSRSGRSGRRRQRT